MTGFIVTVSLLVTYAFWSTSQQKITHKLESNFDNKVNQTIGLIERRMASYEHILKGVQGLFVSSVSVERDEFNQYVKNLNLENTYPGIQGIGYAIKLSKEQIEKHLTQMHKYGFLDYKIQPEGLREYVVPIIYMEPLTEINRKVLGLDPYAMTIPKKAMIIAQDNDIATVSGKITLEQDRGAADKFGFVMYLPVYKNGVPHDSLEDRRKHIVGWIDAPFRASDLIDAIVGESSSDISLKVYDGELISKQTLLYTSSTASENCQFNASNIIQLGGRIWTVEMCSLPSFGQTVTDNEPRLVAYTGMIMSALLGLLIWSMTTGHARALSLAARMTEELRTSAERWKLALDGSGDGVWDWDIQTNEVHFSPRWKEMLGFSDNEIGMSFNEWESRVHPDDLEQAKQTVKEYLQGERSYYTNEIRMQCKDGRWKWILSRGMAVSYDEGKKPLRLIGTHTDITQRKTIEQREKSQNKVLELILNGASLEESLTAIVNEVELVNPSMICSILLLDKQGERLSIGAAPGLPDFYNKAIDGIEIGPEVGSCGTAAFTKQRVIVEDIHSHPYWSPYTELAKKADLGACWSQPIITLENTILGCFAIYHRSTMVPTDDDIKLIEDASKLAGIAIERHYAQEAQQLASTVYKNSSEGIVITNRENVIIAINPAFTELTGYSESEVVGQSPKILSSGKQNNQFYQMMWE
ncbi:MAG: PAS domain S-box protein [Methylophaga sp.]|nr:PAS domain S-box protein [Methylophaga sp.]